MTPERDEDRPDVVADRVFGEAETSRDDLGRGAGREQSEHFRESTNGARPPARREPEPCLTPRQREILALLVDGERAKHIAARLTISETTVRNHIRAILRALGVNSQLEAVARARTLFLPEKPAA